MCLVSELIPLLPIMDAQSCPGRGCRLERAPAESHSVSARAELPPCPGALSRSPGQHLTEVQVQTSALCDPGRVGDLRQCLLRTLAPATPGADQVTPACVYRVRETRGCQGHETGDPGPDPDRVTLTAAQRDSGGNIEIIRRDRFISLALVTIYLTVIQSLQFAFEFRDE